MHCVKFPLTIEETIKKSRFIGAVLPCTNEREILAALNRLAREHSDATHIAFAFRLKTPNGIIARFNDAGEPSGTAGKPIFQHLEGKDLVNVLIAVIRYFGGVKLGAGGLTRAYGNSAKRVIEASTLLPYVEYREMTLEIGYDRLQALEYALSKLDGTIKSQDFSERIKLVISLPAHHAGAIREQFEA
ncbi:MAG: YigZ family protein [Pseudomonadota bacterium]